jgi:Tfp pilus assembly protein PilZ
VVLKKVFFMLTYIQYIYTVYVYNISIRTCTGSQCTRCVHGLATDLYLMLMILRKPEKFHLVVHGAFVTPCGIADLNSNGNVMKRNSNHTH